MDALSQLLNDINMSGAAIRQLRLAAPWDLLLSTPGLASIHLCQQGAGWLLAEDHPPVPLQPGDMVFLPHGTPHHVRDTREGGGVCRDLAESLAVDEFEHHYLAGGGKVTTLLSGHFRYDIDLARPLMDALPRVIHLRAVNGVPAPWLHFGIQFLMTELRGGAAGLQVVVNRAGDIILVQCLRHCLEELPMESDSWLLAFKDRALSAVLVAMHGEPGRNWTVPKLASIASLSRSAFVNRFKACMGKPPLTYLREHRMRLAAWKLRNTRQPVWQIAEQLGYGSDVALTQAFKRTFDQTPSKYRQTAPPTGR